MTGQIVLRSVEDRDRDWIAGSMRDEWGSETVVSRGRLTERCSTLPGFVAERDGERAGFVLLRDDADETEVVVLRAVVEREGVGTALLRAAEEEAARRGTRRLWLITTNDNLDAIRFYQRRGWELIALHRDALAESRRLKPDIPEVGDHGIPLRHELEFEAPLGRG